MARVKFGDVGTYDPPYEVMFTDGSQVGSVHLCIGKAPPVSPQSADYLVFMGEDDRERPLGTSFGIDVKDIYRNHCSWVGRNSIVLYALEPDAEEQFYRDAINET